MVFQQKDSVLDQKLSQVTSSLLNAEKNNKSWLVH